jgi:hypothetical protein
VSIPFSRSTRSLASDSYRPAMIGLGLAVVTLVALIIWFFLARISLYQTSASAVLKADGQVIAAFPAETFAQIQPGQEGILRLGQSGDQRPLSVPVMVFDTQGGAGEVVLVVTDYSALPETLPEETPGRVDIETERIAPADLLLRASGKFLSRGGPPAGGSATSTPAAQP